MTSIYYETFPVAHMTFTGEWRLDYDHAREARGSAFPVSLTMPLRSGSVNAERLLPWLANLLPEAHLAEIGQRLKVSPQDIVGLLGHIGRDTAGALSIGEPRKAGINLKGVQGEAALERILNELRPSRRWMRVPYVAVSAIPGVCLKPSERPSWPTAQRALSRIERVQS